MNNITCKIDIVTPILKIGNSRVRTGDAEVKTACGKEIKVSQMETLLLLSLLEWKYCPHCGGMIESVSTSYDEVDKTGYG